MNGRSWIPAVFSASLPFMAGSFNAQAANPDSLIRLLEQRSCPRCRLQDADLVNADLRDANLKGAQLQRANLSGAQLDGADLSGAVLSETSLLGASLRGANLRGARLDGTDLRHSDLNGAQLDHNALDLAHWQLATGVDLSQLGYITLHNAGVNAFQMGRQPDAERFFGEAIRQQPEAGVSWVARGLSRLEQGKTELAAQDFDYAAKLYEQVGDDTKMKQLNDLAKGISKPPAQSKGGNGFGSQLIQGAMAAFQALAPIAVKTFAGGL